MGDGESDGRASTASALQGRYALFRAGKDAKDWMIHRIDPPARERDPFPEDVVPMLARLVDRCRATTTSWAVEVKWDGVRAIAYCRPGRVRLQTRNLNDVTAAVPGGEAALARGSAPATRSSTASWSPSTRTAGRASSGCSSGSTRPSASVVRRRMKSHPVVYVVFDLLYLDGHDLTGEPYSAAASCSRGWSSTARAGRRPATRSATPSELLDGKPRAGPRGDGRSSGSTAPTPPASAPAPG